MFKRRLRLWVATLLFAFAAPAAASLPFDQLQLHTYAPGIVFSCLESSASPDGRLRQRACRMAGLDQMWRFQPTSDGAYRVVNMRSNKCLDVEWGATWQFGRVLEWPCHGQANQRWDVSLRSNGISHEVMLRSRQSGLCLDMAGGIAVQTPCNLATRTGAIWSGRTNRTGMVRAPGASESLSVVRGGLCANNVLGSLFLSACSPATNVWLVPLYETSEYFRIQSNDFKQCMTTQWHAGWQHAVMRPCTAYAGGHEQWQLIDSNGAWMFRHISTGQCLNAQHGTAYAGTRLIVWPCAPASDNARWTLRRH